MYGLHGHRVDWLRGRLTVVDVMTRQGLRQWPKSKRSHRVVPVPAATLERMSALLAGRGLDELVFTAPHGGPVTDEHFRNRVWYPAVEAAGIRRVPAAHHAAHRGVVAGAGRRAALRRPGAARSRGLRDDDALRAPGTGRAQQGSRLVGEASGNRRGTMKLLTATTSTQGQRDSDFDWCIEGEVVTPLRVICDSDREEGPDGGCGCGRSFSGLSSHKGTTTAVVRDIDGYTFEDLTEAVRSHRDQAGYDASAAEAEASHIAALADEYDAGTVLELRLDDIEVRALGA
jgi:hypothetical protein